MIMRWPSEDFLERAQATGAPQLPDRDELPDRDGPARDRSSATTFTLLVSFFLSSREDRKKAAREERQELNARYLNLLRLHLAENRFRLAEILHRTGESGQCEDLLTIDAPADLSDRDPGWFTNWGAYLASTAYLTACLFAWLNKTRDSAPYLRLGTDDDTRLSVLMLRVSHCFLRDQGIYYVLQPSIGQDRVLAAQDRLLSYRE